ncbi:MAG: ribbon-helix-helix protein, CopG family [Dehalococcoidia bacterium]
MPQLALYLDPDIAARLDAAARRAGKSRSAFAREVLKEKLYEMDCGWTPEMLATIGSWTGEESLEELVRGTPDVPDSPREEIS